MEDEAAKRRERLKALRKDAEQTDQLDGPASSLPSGSLSNPFADTSDTSHAVDNSSHAPRFDYYTDPLSAFSANKRRNIDQDQLKPSSRKLVRNKKAICTCEAPMLGPCLRCKVEEEEREEEKGQMLSCSARPDQLQVQYPPGERPMGGNTLSAGRHYPWSSPMPIPYPPPSGSPRPNHFDWNSYGNHQGYGLNSFPHPICQNQMYPLPPSGPSGQNAWNPSGNQRGFPLGLRSPSPVYPQGNAYSPIFDHGRRGGPIPAGGRNSYAPPYGRGSGGRFGRGNEIRPLFVGRGSMGHDHDQSRNLGFDNRGMKPVDNILNRRVDFQDGVEHGFDIDSPGLKLGMDRRKHTDHVDNLSGSSSGLNRKGFKSFDEKAKLFYLDSMLADPWHHMNPVVRNPSQTTMSCPDSEKRWLPNSIRSKSAKPEETMKFRSDLNFVDCLADSLKEATGSM